MALVLLGKSACALCGQVLCSDQDNVLIPAVPIRASSLARFADVAVHLGCFMSWSLRPMLIAEINSYYDAHYRGMRYMNEDGSIEDRDPTQDDWAKPHG